MARYLDDVEFLILRMHKYNEEYGDIEEKMVQWRSILIHFFKKTKPKFLQLQFAHHLLLYRFVKLLEEVFKICKVNNIRINVEFVANQGGLGQGPFLREQDVAVEPLEIFHFMNEIETSRSSDEVFFFSYPKLLTSLTKFSSYGVKDATILKLLEITSFTDLRLNLSNKW